ncbi:MAG: hypothetical protein D6681_06730 [Calditrichaeota bacterium]|nr:MAG: hypothetical protein D6681_06730 [Calditrichota bacterium]
MNKQELYRPLVENLRKAFGDRLKAVVLFGSQARSEEILERDHDILVVIEGLPRNPLYRLKEVRQTILDIPLQINFIAKTPEEVAANLTPLMLEVCLDGLCLYGEAYFRPFRERALKALKQSGLKRVQVGQEWYWRFEKAPARDWELTWDGYRELP